MSPNMSVLVGAFFLLLVTIPISVESQNHTKPLERGLKFFKNLEGSYNGQTVEGLEQIKRYLEKFGYLNYNTHYGSNLDEFHDVLESAVKLYQSKHHLNVTGTLNSETVDQMMQPRCGFPDIINNFNHANPGRKMKHPKVFDIISKYNFIGPKWPPSKTRLTYSFKSSAEVSVSPEDLSLVMERAFRRWKEVSIFTFFEVPEGNKSDIVIGFHRGNHGDGVRNAFDGPHGVYAHAFAPTSGVFHYDADENWSTSPTQDQVDLESVAVHELGHVLGLAHSEDKTAVMYPYFAYGKVYRDLQADDILGIHNLYTS